MNIENNPIEERELLFEIYKFTASNGKIYYIKPASLKEIMSPDSEFSKALDIVGIPAVASGGNPRLYCVSALKDEKRRKILSDIISRYVTLNGEPVTLDSLDKDGLTIDDIVLIIKRFAGISG